MMMKISNLMQNTLDIMYWVLNYPAVVQTSEGRVLVLDFTGMDIAVGICCCSLVYHAVMYSNFYILCAQYSNW